MGAAPPPILDQPPPNPTSPSAQFGGVPAGPVPGTPDAGEGDPAAAIAKAGSMVDQAIEALMQMAPAGSAELGQARNLIKQGLAKELASQGQAPASSPTATGASFQGGGIGNPNT